MADYDWAKDCGCPLMGPHKDFCPDNYNYKYNIVKRDAIEAALERLFVCIDYAQGLWGCEQCGIVVWEMNSHRTGAICPIVRKPAPETYISTAPIPPRCPDCKAFIWEDQEHVCPE